MGSVRSGKPGKPGSKIVKASHVGNLLVGPRGERTLPNDVQPLAFRTTISLDFEALVGWEWR